MTLNGCLTIALFAFPPVYSLVRYYRRPPGQRPGKAETAGILVAAIGMVTVLVFMMWQRIFF